jgi:hypothetical protein
MRQERVPWRSRRTGTHHREESTGAPFLASFARSGIGRDKNSHRGILGGLEGVSGKKAVDSAAEIATVASAEILDSPSAVTQVMAPARGRYCERTASGVISAACRPGV